ncbi:MAG: hypothetical protein N2578_05280, partial [Bdellovibrionaceae bacterium]|nr:hypothetical protein [Pseudobdellovibrionaceae bacterium]
MAQKTDRKSPVHSKLTGIQNLRSVNIAIDINDPSRLVGYVPTNKALSLTTEVLSSLIGRNDTRSFAIAAPYGSGKSSIALFWAQLVENSPHKAPELKTLIESFKRHTPSRENVFFQWEKQHAFGLTIPLVGAESTDVFALVHQGILDALRRRGLKELAKDIARLNPDFGGFQKTVDLLSRANRIIGGRLLIIWDEFGKFLEQAVATGDGKAMLHIQTLAEYCSRTKENFPVVFVILLHQSFARYASSMPAYVRNEWAKVEGRFRQINYIEDSKEVYELISQVVSRKHGQPASDRKTFEALAKSCHQVQIFKDFDRESLVDLLWSAAPLSPVSLYLLPRISARVAQNERSLFSFLSSQEPHALPSLNKEWITPADLYDYFEDLMRVDTSVGGSHRLWVEANAALKKAETEKEKELIKALSCIKLGSSSNSLPGSLPVINLAFGQTDKKSESEWQRLADRLLRAKAIYYKKLSGEFSVWQGSDVDIRSAVEEQKGKFLETLELVPILAKNFPCPYRFPQRYNDHYYIRRYFDGRYASLDDLKTLRYSIVPFQDDPFLDGRILYVPVETKEDWEEACRLAKESSLPDNVVIAIPQSPIVLREPLAEMLAYQELLRDPDFLGQDPILDKELKILADENEQFLRGLMDRLIQPSEHGPIFFSGGKKYDSVASMGELKRLLSKITEKVFPLTPRFNNEMINKTDPTPQIVNARKNILWGILQSYGKEDLGLKGYGPDVSIFRATFLLNGLYRKQDIGEWTFEDNPENLKDAGLKAVRREVVQYFTDPRYSPRDLTEFIEKLKSPPY